MPQIRSHRDLLVWQRGMDLVQSIYQPTKQFPDDERFQLVSQATRAAVAVPANIGEGHACGTRRDYANFVAIAKGSLMELETYVMISERLGHVRAARLPEPRDPEFNRVVSRALQTGLVFTRSLGDRGDLGDHLSRSPMCMFVDSHPRGLLADGFRPPRPPGEIEDGSDDSTGIGSNLNPARPEP